MAIQLHLIVVEVDAIVFILWSPATGLSATNVARPNIYIGNDTLTYTITAIRQDIQGKLLSEHIRNFLPLTDITACPGCPVILQAKLYRAQVIDGIEMTLIAGAFEIHILLLIPEITLFLSFTNLVPYILILLHNTFGLTRITEIFGTPILIA